MAGSKEIEALLKLKSLTPRELELHKELIDESISREAMIRESTLHAQSSLQQLAEACDAATKRARLLAEAIEKVLDEMESLCLKLLPDDVFYRE
jgi:predicted DNA-binding protein